VGTRLNTDLFPLNLPPLILETNMVVMVVLLLCITIMLWIVDKEIHSQVTLDQVKELLLFLVYMVLERMHLTALIQDTLSLRVTHSHVLNTIKISNLSNYSKGRKLFRVSRTLTRLCLFPKN
jgi:hypothetical protein